MHSQLWPASSPLSGPRNRVLHHMGVQEEKERKPVPDEWASLAQGRGREPDFLSSNFQISGLRIFLDS